MTTFLEKRPQVEDRGELHFFCPGAFMCELVACFFVLTNNC